MLSCAGQISCTASRFKACEPETVAEAMIRVEVCWVEPEGGEKVLRQDILVPAAARILDIVRHPDLPAGLFEALAKGELRAAVYGELREPESPVCDGDRVELLTGVTVDPKESRARRAEVQRRRRGDQRWQRR